MKNKMSNVRDLMIEAMENLLDPESDFDVNKAKAVAKLGDTLVKSAKVEVDYIRATGADISTGFINLNPDEKPKQIGG